MLIVVGAVLARHSGVMNVIGLACLAYGIGLAVAAAFIYLGRNPVTPWYRFGTGCIVLSVQSVHLRKRQGREGRPGTHTHHLLAGWGPKGRWFKSSRPD